MTRFRVLIHGKNFLFSRNPIFEKFRKAGTVRLGFHTAKYVNADSPEEAQEMAIDIIRKELKDEILNDRGNPPAMYIEEVISLPETDEIAGPGKGYSFYAEDKASADIFDDKEL